MEKGPASEARKEPGGIMALSGAEYVTKAAIAANWGHRQARRWAHATGASWTTYSAAYSAAYSWGLSRAHRVAGCRLQAARVRAAGGDRARG